MILNDMRTKVEGKFFKEITIDDDGEDLTYVFPDTKEFINVLRRSLNKKVVS